MAVDDPDPQSDTIHIPPTTFSVPLHSQLGPYSSTQLPVASPSSTYSPTDAEQPTTIPTNTIIAGVLGGVGVLVICLAVFVVFRIRYHSHPRFWGNYPSANSQKTLYSTQRTHSTSKVSHMDEEAPIPGRRRTNPLDLSSMQSTSVETIKQWDRPTIEINTNIPVKARKSTTNASAYFLAQKRRMDTSDRGIAPHGEEEIEKDRLSISSCPASFRRSSTSLSNASTSGKSTISPIAFADSPSCSHLPLSLRPVAPPRNGDHNDPSSTFPPQPPQ